MCWWVVSFRIMCIIILFLMCVWLGDLISHCVSIIIKFLMCVSRRSHLELCVYNYPNPNVWVGVPIVRSAAWLVCPCQCSTAEGCFTCAQSKIFTPVREVCTSNPLGGGSGRGGVLCFFPHSFQFTFHMQSQTPWNSVPVEICGVLGEFDVN